MKNDTKIKKPRYNGGKGRRYNTNLTKLLAVELYDKMTNEGYTGHFIAPHTDDPNHVYNMNQPLDEVVVISDRTPQQRALLRLLLQAIDALNIANGNVDYLNAAQRLFEANSIDAQELALRNDAARQATDWHAGQFIAKSTGLEWFANKLLQGAGYVGRLLMDAPNFENMAQQYTNGTYEDFNLGDVQKGSAEAGQTMGEFAAYSIPIAGLAAFANDVLQNPELAPFVAAPGLIKPIKSGIEAVENKILLKFPLYKYYLRILPVRTARNVAAGTVVGGMAGFDYANLTDQSDNAEKVSIILGSMLGGIGGKVASGLIKPYRIGNKKLMTAMDAMEHPIDFYRARKDGMYPLTRQEARKYIEKENQIVQQAKNDVRRQTEEKANFSDNYRFRPSAGEMYAMLNELIDKLLSSLDDIEKQIKKLGEDAVNEKISMDQWLELNAALKKARLKIISDYGLAYSEDAFDLGIMDKYGIKYKLGWDVPIYKNSKYVGDNNIAEYYKGRVLAKRNTSAMFTRLPEKDPLTGKRGWNAKKGIYVHELEHAILDKNLNTQYTEPTSEYYVTNRDSQIYDEIEPLMQKTNGTAWLKSIDEVDSEFASYRSQKNLPMWKDMSEKQKLTATYLFGKRFKQNNHNMRKILDIMSKYGMI